ncbi:YbaK/EbsC family protein [Rubrobacter taiwanensis]|uniref:YbaK/EbsC family protein n=1 Tax=Rubrobacter taiwanensis TaxID=185139 RepID=UPI001FB52BFA|nr:YbaK/EbsC family protein [Rubrobacter taiwanensis]
MRIPERLPPSAQRVQEELKSRGYPHRVVETEETTRSAEEAARAVGCGVGQIVKSLVFRGRDSGRPILILASGANRVDVAKIGKLAGEPVEKPDAKFVREHTGFAIGGVPPVGHPERLQTYIDEDLMRYGEVWAAGGTPNHVFRLAPNELADMTGGKVAVTK